MKRGHHLGAFSGMEFGLRRLPGEGAWDETFHPSIPDREYRDARDWGDTFNQTVSLLWSTINSLLG